MKLNIFLTIKSLIALIFGIAMMAIPAQTLAIYGITTDPVGLNMTRYFGVGFIAIGLICWFARNAAVSSLLQDILLSMFVADTVGFFVALSFQLSGLPNALGWVNAVIWLLLSVGLGYYRFLSQDVLNAAPLGR